MKRVKLCILLICTAVLTTILTGCGAAGGMMDMESSKGYDSYNSAEMPSMGINSPASGKSDSYEESQKTASTDNGNSDLEQQAESARKLIRKVNLRTESLEFDQFIDYITTQTKTYGGYIEASGISGSNYNYSSKSRSASLTIRIPAAYLDILIGEIGNIANITYKNETAEDVTLSYLETESRVASLEIQRDKLLEWMEEAETVEDLITLESRLNEVRYELEYYASILRNYDNLVAYSTIYLDVSEVERITPVVEESIGSRMASGISETWYDIKEGAVDFSVWFVTNLPYLIIWAIVIAAVVLIVRALYKKEKKRIAKYNQTMQENRLYQQQTQPFPQNQQVPQYQQMPQNEAMPQNQQPKGNE